MLTIIKTVGDIFDTQADAICNPVNARAISGAGIAAFCAKKWPIFENSWREYAETHKNSIKIGDVFPIQLYKSDSWQYLFNVVTMLEPGSKVNAIDIAESITGIIKTANRFDINSVVVPYLGCGVGRFAESDFERLLKCASNHRPLTILLVKYRGW